jgi:hypothetical protein
VSLGALAFTGKYAESIGAKGFIIRPLTYGLIPDFNGQYQTIKMNIDKIGGFFDTNLNNNQSLDPESYYLNALYLDEFYFYKPEVCENQPEIHLGIPTL